MYVLRTRRARTRPLPAVLVLVALLTALWGLGAATAADSPTVTVERDLLAAGETVQVSGEGWVKDDQLEVSVCAQPDRSGAMNCAPGVSNVPVMWDGSFSTPLTVELPEAACPCSIVADSPQAPPVMTPVLLEGSSTAKASKAPALVVERAELVGGSSLSTWFGAGARPTLELVLRNDGTAPASPVLDLHWRNGDGEQHDISAPQVEKIAPGGRVSFDIPVQLDGMAQGEHSVGGIARVGDLEASIRATTTVVPWGLYGALAVALLIGSALRTRWVVSQMDRDGEGERPARRAKAPARAPSSSGARQGSRAQPRPKVSEKPREVPPEPVTVPEVEAAALATMERFAATREAELGHGGVDHVDPEHVEPGRAEPDLSVPRQRAPSGGRRAHRASSSWITRR